MGAGRGTLSAVEVGVGVVLEVVRLRLRLRVHHGMQTDRRFPR